MSLVSDSIGNSLFYMNFHFFLVFQQQQVLPSCVTRSLFSLRLNICEMFLFLSVSCLKSLLLLVYCDYIYSSDLSGANLRKFEVLFIFYKTAFGLCIYSISLRGQIIVSFALFTRFPPTHAYFCILSDQLMFVD